MKIAAAILLLIGLVLVGVRVYSFFGEERQLNHDLADIEARLMKAKIDEANLEAETRYLANPANLEKELRARFNYKKPGEKMIIIVPSLNMATSTSASD